MDKKESISVAWNRIYLLGKVGAMEEVNKNWVAWLTFHSFLLEKLFLSEEQFCL